MGRVGGTGAALCYPHPIGTPSPGCSLRAPRLAHSKTVQTPGRPQRRSAPFQTRMTRPPTARQGAGVGRSPGDVLRARRGPSCVYEALMGLSVLQQHVSLPTDPSGGLNRGVPACPVSGEPPSGAGCRSYRHSRRGHRRLPAVTPSRVISPHAERCSLHFGKAMISWNNYSSPRRQP